MAETDLSRRVDKLENVVEPLPRLEAKQHAHANLLQVHASHLSDILGPKGSMLMRLGKVEGAIELFDERLKRIDEGVDGIKGSVSKLIDVTAKLAESNEIQKANVAGQWQMRATMFTAVLAGLSAIAVAAMKFL